jgi:twitching motility protein PilI
MSLIHTDMDKSEDHSEMETNWLPPDDALAYFEPPVGVQLAVVKQEQQSERARYGFRIGDLGLLIDANTGSEVLAMPPVATLPNTPPGFLGLINLRGNLVPVYELRTLLDFAQRPSGVQALVLVFGKDEHAVGVSIDGYPDALLELRPILHLPTLPDVLRKHVSAGFIKDDTIWLEFNHHTFFEAISDASAPHQKDVTERFDS